jgi:nucleotide-binding universal stress UspA family protein
MFEDVVVALDGSDARPAVLWVAEALARPHATSVTLLSVADREDAAAVQAYLDEIAAATASSTTIELLTDGDPAERIAAWAAGREGCVLCMASHARRPLAETLLGSVTASVVHAAVAPVVVAGPQLQPPDRGRFSDVVVAVDGSTFAEQALPIAVGAALALDVRLHVIEVRDPRDGSDDFVEATARRCRMPEDRKEAHVVLAEHPAAGIVDYASSLVSPLLVMSTHARGPVSRTVLGSVAAKVIRTAHFPVLLVRPS